MNSKSLNRRTVIGGLLLGAAALALGGRKLLPMR